jgi:hypothetical protein
MPQKIKKRLSINARTAAIEFGLALFLLILLAGAIEIGFFVWQRTEDYVATQAGLGLTDGAALSNNFSSGFLPFKGGASLLVE